MYAFLFFTIIIVMMAFAFYNTFIANSKKDKINSPKHFELMDNEGNPLPSSDDRSRSFATQSQSFRVVAGSFEDKETEVERLRYFCIKDKGYHVSVWPKDQGFQGVDYIEFNVAGITHGEHIDDHLGEFVATLEPDPANPYDAQAIKILARNGDRVGYVPKDMTEEVRKFSQLPCKCYCYIGINNGTYYTDCYITPND